MPKIKILYIILSLTIIIVLVIALASLARIFKPIVVKQVNVEGLKVEVLNGCGKPKVARLVTYLLRQKGIDVVKIGNADSFNIPHTMVIDRAGNFENSKTIAKSIGVNYVVKAKDEFAVVDATIIIGLDYEKIFPNLLKEVDELR